MTTFDEKDYWRKRHEDHRGQLKAVGIDTVDADGNQGFYGQLVDRYRELLDRLDLPRGTTALDAGSGVGTLTRLLHERGFEVTAVDISQTALDGIDLPITKVCSPLATADLPERGFEYVHSFDVVYHIMDEAEWAASVANLGRWSSRYVVMHERFQRIPQWVPSKIMKMRPKGETAAILASQGFREVMTVPTHLTGMHLLTYRLSALAPERFLQADDWVFSRFGDSPVVRELASHRIKVFERA